MNIRIAQAFLILLAVAAPLGATSVWLSRLTHTSVEKLTRLFQKPLV